MTQEEIKYDEIVGIFNKLLSYLRQDYEFRGDIIDFLTDESCLLTLISLYEDRIKKSKEETIQTIEYKLAS